MRRMTSSQAPSTSTATPTSRRPCCSRRSRRSGPTAGIRTRSILSPRRDSAAQRAFGETTDASPHSGATPGIRWGTVHRYKGLESPVAIVTDVDGRSPGWEDLLYVGMTRATERLIVLTSLEDLHERM
ncbi:ATP-binding domain-containing protein [Agrococcus baldri]|uniref:ATP-binding domain-containing protein n=1 Tax=Agrococcus baldri TaxID=153730 RepID=UPI0011BFA057|nr:ATP-binding domain-containing protein [Agrococcus baldri]